MQVNPPAIRGTTRRQALPGEKKADPLVPVVVDTSYLKREQKSHRANDDQDEKVFHSVVVVTDRLVLDQQLQDTIYQFEHKQGVVQKIDQDSTQLAQALAAGVPIVITTLQKFPFVTEKIGALPKRKYAVIVDEAHSSQGGESATELKGVLSTLLLTLSSAYPWGWVRSL